MNNSDTEKEIMVTVSKVKKYIRSASGMNTAASVAPALSDAIYENSDFCSGTKQQKGA